MLKGYMSPFDATVVENLGNAGMVTLGKLNCDEFAMGSSNENSYYGNVLNPWDRAPCRAGVRVARRRRSQHASPRLRQQPIPGGRSASQRPFQV
jgi:Asp-tRNA(Asn)/Glu-tRNA(Gln) amidotransferase A subunit family amidase